MAGRGARGAAPGRTAGAARAPARVARIACAEPVAVDPAPLADLRRRLGPSGAEAAASRALDAAGHLLARLSSGGMAADADRIGEDASALRDLASGLGLRTLARAAAHLSDAARRRDPAALGATLDRIERVGHRSLAAIWDH